MTFLANRDVRDAPRFSELESLGARLLTTSSYAFAVLVASAAISFLVQLGTVRLIGAESFGAFAYVIAWTTVLGYVATLGFHMSLLKLLPAYQVAGEWAKARGVVRFSLVGTAVSGLLLAALVAVIARAVYGPGSELRAAFLVSAAVVPLLALRLVGAAMLRAFGGVISSMLPERILRDALGYAFLLAAVTLGIAAPSAVTAMGATLVAAVVALVCIERLIAARRPAEAVAPTRDYALGEWLRPAVPLTLIVLSDTLMSRGGQLVIGSRGDTVEVGIFAIAFSLAQLASLPRMSVASLFAPTVSALYASRNIAGLQRLIERAAALSLLGTLAVVVPLAIGAPFLLPLFGPRFVEAEPLLFVLLLGQMAAAASGPQQHLLTMTGHEWQGASLMAAAAAANVALAFLLYPAFGMVAVAAASSIALVAWNTAMAWFLNRRLGLRPGLAPARWLRRGSQASGEKP
jgi:O-antigen/teichoic acid export membrane protein